MFRKCEVKISNHHQFNQSQTVDQVQRLAACTLSPKPQSRTL